MALRAAALRQRLVDTRGARPTTPRDLRRLAFNRQAIDAGLNLRHTANYVQRAAATISRIVSFGDRLAGRATRGYVHWYRTSRERPVLTASPAAGGPGPSECPQIQCSRGESSIASLWLHLDSSGCRDARKIGGGPRGLPRQGAAQQPAPSRCPIGRGSSCALDDAHSPATQWLVGLTPLTGSTIPAAVKRPSDGGPAT
jgi:hypothetical protein